MAAPVVKILESDVAVAEELCSFVVQTANHAIKERNFFFVGVSGGSLIKYLCNGLPSLETDWSKWRIFFCDERHVPYTDPECTYSHYKEGLVDKVGMTSDNIFPINPDISVEDAAVAYEKKVREYFSGPELPRFDMLLLGMGPDGHTCSLFPDHKLLEEKDRVIAPISDSPKPPPSRVTMTLPVVNNCRCAVFASCGAGKADILQRVLEGNETPALPAARVRPTDGELIWLLDKPAAEKLKCKM